jgi:hypothetical protein
MRYGCKFHFEYIIIVSNMIKNNHDDDVADLKLNRYITSPSFEDP